MNTKPRPPRLPGYDRSTGRGELVAFAALGLMGVWLAGTAWRQASNFAVERENIAAALSCGDMLAVAGRTGTNHALTNLTALPAGGESQPGRTRVNPS